MEQRPEDAVGEAVVVSLRDFGRKVDGDAGEIVLEALGDVVAVDIRDVKAWGAAGSARLRRGALSLSHLAIRSTAEPIHGQLRAARGSSLKSTHSKVHPLLAARQRTREPSTRDGESIASFDGRIWGDADGEAIGDNDERSGRRVVEPGTFVGRLRGARALAVERRSSASATGVRRRRRHLIRVDPRAG